MKKGLIYICILLLLQHTTIWAKEQRMEKILLSTALKEQKITLKGVSTKEPYNGKGLRITIENITRENLLLVMDSAIIMRPEDAENQNLIIGGTELLAINAGKPRILELQTYCGESDDQAPVADHPYHFESIGSSNIGKVLAFVKANAVSNDMAQHAVWVLTNKHSLSDVYDYNNPELSRKLVAYMGQLLGLEAPQYFTVKEINAIQGAAVRPDKTLKLVANLQWTLSAPEKLSLSIYNDKNERVASYFTGKDFIKGRYDLNASFETIDYPSGDYTIRLQTNTQEVLKEIKVRLE